MKKLIVLFIFLFLLACASAWGYEFHLKNGAVIKGESYRLIAEGCSNYGVKDEGAS